MSDDLTALKEKCLKLIDDLHDNDNPVIVAFRDFVESYDGTNVADFSALCVSFVGLILRVRELEVVEKGYDELMSVRKEVESTVDDLRAAWQRAEEGNVVEPPTE